VWNGKSPYRRTTDNPHTGSNPVLTTNKKNKKYMSKAKNIKLKLACLEQWMASNNINKKEAKEDVKKSYSNYKGKSHRGPRGKR